MGKHSQSIEKDVLKRIRGMGRGWVFTPSHFTDFGARPAVGMALTRLVKDGEIRKLARGLYDYPRNHPRFGRMAPTDDAIANAIRSRDDSRIQISGAHSANLLGLSTQVPMRTVYLTDGRSRKVKVDNREIILKKTTTKQMATAGKISGTVFQALCWIGKRHMDESIIAKLKNYLSDQQKKQILKDIRFAPEWIAEIMREVARDLKT